MSETAAKPSLEKTQDKRRDRLGVAVVALVLLVVVGHPTSWAFGLGWLGRLLGFSRKICEKAPHLAVADVLIWVAGALLVARIVVERDWKRLKMLSLPGVLLAAWAVASMLFAPNKLTAVAEAVQFVEYFVVLYLLVVTVTSTSERLLSVLNLWLVVGCVVAVAGLVDYLGTPAADASSRCIGTVAGPLANRNVYGGYLAILAPMAFGLALVSGRWTMIVQGAALAVVGLATVLAGGPWLGMVVGMAVVAFVRSTKVFVIFAAALLVLALVAAPMLPHDNLSVLRQSVQVFDEDASAAPPLAPAIEEWRRIEPSLPPAADNALAPNDEQNLRLRAFGRTLKGASDSVVAVDRLNPRYVEWQLAMKFLTPGIWREMPNIRARDHARRLILGVGVGNYREVNQFYGALPKPNANTTEPDTANLYLVLAVSAGIPAALIFLWLVGAHLRRAAVGYLATDDPALKGLLLGGIAALVSLLVTNIFTDTLVRGTGPATILVLALVASAASLVERKSSASQ